MLRVLLEKYTAQEKEHNMDNVSSEMGTKNLKETTEVKNTVTEMKNAFGDLISRLAKEKVSELEYVNTNFLR